MAPFQKFVIARAHLPYGDVRRLTRHVQTWQRLDAQARENYRPRLRSWRLTAAFVVITTAIERPVYMIFGPILAAALYLTALFFFIQGFLKG